MFKLRHLCSSVHFFFFKTWREDECLWHLRTVFCITIKCRKCQYCLRIPFKTCGKSLQAVSPKLGFRWHQVETNYFGGEEVIKTWLCCSDTLREVRWLNPISYFLPGIAESFRFLLQLNLRLTKVTGNMKTNVSILGLSLIFFVNDCRPNIFQKLLSKQTEYNNGT